MRDLVGGHPVQAQLPARRHLRTLAERYARAALFLRDLVMPLAFRVFATEKAMSWIYDYEVPWDEPVVGKAA